MSSIFDIQTVLKAGRRAAEVARHGTREEQSGRFLPPPRLEGPSGHRRRRGPEEEAGVT